LRSLAPFVGVLDRWFHGIRWAPALGPMFRCPGDDPPSRDKSVSHRWSIAPVRPFRAGHRFDRPLASQVDPHRSATRAGRVAPLEGRADADHQSSLSTASPAGLWWKEEYCLCCQYHYAVTNTDMAVQPQGCTPLPTAAAPLIHRSIGWCKLLGDFPCTMSRWTSLGGCRPVLDSQAADAAKLAGIVGHEGGVFRQCVARDTSSMPSRLDFDRPLIGVDHESSL